MSDLSPCRLADAFADDRFDAIVKFADEEISLWLSVREAAYRRETQTLEIHCPKIRVLTMAVLSTVKELGAGLVENAGAT